MRISEVRARQLLDCKCRPIVEVEVICEDGSVGRGAAPTGSSVGMHEASVLRDGDPKRFLGQGVLKAVKNVNTTIRRRLVGMIATNQYRIDQALIDLDPTANKGKLGANAILGVSLADG